MNFLTGCIRVAVSFIRKVSNVCLRTSFVLQGIFHVPAYALRLSCASIKAFLKAFKITT